LALVRLSERISCKIHGFLCAHMCERSRDHFAHEEISSRRKTAS
jgi:hypothetical protein